MSIGDKLIYPGREPSEEYEHGMTFREWLIGKIACDVTVIIGERIVTTEPSGEPERIAKFTAEIVDAIIKQIDGVNGG